MRGALEFKVLDILRSSKSSQSVRDVLRVINEDRENPLAYTTVLTVLNRLTAKGAVERKRTGRFFLYLPTAEDEAALAVRYLLERHGVRAVAHFLRQVQADHYLCASLEEMRTHCPRGGSKSFIAS